MIDKFIVQPSLAVWQIIYLQHTIDVRETKKQLFNAVDKAAVRILADLGDDDDRLRTGIQGECQCLCGGWEYYHHDGDYYKCEQCGGPFKQ